MTTPLAAALIAVITATMPSDPAQRCAAKALANAYGPLHDWQRVGYTSIRDQGATCTVPIWRTAYYATEGRSGRVDRKGRACTLRTCASNTIPEGSYVWFPDVGLRQVRDCGAKRNTAIARRKGARHWADCWFAKKADCPFTTGVVRGAVAP